MAQPTNWANGDQPDGTRFAAWNTWFTEGRAIYKGTYAVIKAKAAAEPTYPLIAVATDTKCVVLYVGDATVGDGGFFVIASYGGTINTTEVG